MAEKNNSRRPRLRKLKSGEFRYRSLSGRLRITKPKNTELWLSRHRLVGDSGIYNLTSEYERILTGRTVATLVEKKPLPPERSKLMYRLTIALNYTNRNEYYSYTVQVYSDNKSELEKEVEDVREDVWKWVEKKLKYPRTEFWFADVPNASIQEMPYDSSLIGKRIENDEYIPIGAGKKAAKKLQAARDKHDTLDNWVGDYEKGL